MGLAESARRRDIVELRIANLRRELDAETEPRARAAILYQVGALYEHELELTPEAMEQYGQSHAVAPGFQPALIAQLRIAERAESGYDLAALRSEQVARATSPAVSSAALVDLAMHSEDWASLLREAISRSSEPAVPALILEWLAEARGEDGAVRDALMAQAKHAADPILRAALWIDIALHELRASRPDDALAALEHACECHAVAWQARSLQAHTARAHQRWDELVLALTSMARMLEAAIEPSGSPDPLGLPVPEGVRRPMAAQLWQEAATCSAMHLDDATAAAGYLESALRWMPESLLIRQQSLLTAERLGDGAAVENASNWFRSMAPEDPAFVAHELRLAGSSADLDSALETLRDATERFPDSSYAQAALDVALIRGARHGERAEAFRQAAELAEGETQAQLAWRAAQLCSANADSSDHTQALYSSAIEASTTSKTAIIREALGAAMRAKRPEAVLTRFDQLMQRDIEPDERAALACAKYNLLRHALHRDEDADQLLRDALGDSNHRAWAPALARAQAAWRGDAGLLARAHEESAEIASGDRRVGHLCAAAQAYAQSRDWEAAERVLRSALAAAPNDGHVVSLLDAILREGGRPEDVVSLARERSQADSTTPLGELSLLLAGASAERFGNPTAARQAYEQALVDAPDSTSAALAVLDVARRQGDANATERAYASLSESRFGGGVPQLFALLLGDALGPDDDGGVCRAYERALEHPSTATAAAIAILSLPVKLSEGDQRAAAEELLADEGAATLEDMDGFAAAYGALRASLGEESSFAGDAWLRLSAAAPTEALRAGALLQGLRASGIARGTDAADELFMRAQEAEALAGFLPDAAVAIDEVLSPNDDAALRVHALVHKLGHSAALGRGALDAAHCRALVEAGRGAEAVALLSNAVDARPDDLALWETLRSAARQAGDWPLVAQACERLAPFVEDALRGDLLEEAGVVRMDCLQQFQQAEDLFRRALDEDPSRDLAFRRLRDLFVAQEDTEALEVLVAGRLALGGPKDRLDLLYDRARLLRGVSDRPGALEVLDELFTSDPAHPGALALAAEVHASLKQWAEAVDCLQRLSRASIPDDQRRVAHLGAAGFLENQLGAKAEALEELRAVEALGLTDAETWTRIAALEIELGRPEAAADAYRRALEAEPANDTAISGLVELVDQTEVETAVARYETAIWSRIGAGELDASLLEALRSAAAWRGHDARAAAVQEVQRALGLAQPVDDHSVELSSVSIAALWDPNADPVLQELVLRAGPDLGNDRLRSKKVASSEPICSELEQLSQRFGAKTGSIEISSELNAPVARTSRSGEIRWVVPERARGGLDATGRFLAGRLAWAAPHGGAQLLDGSPEQAAGTLLEVLRVSRCDVEAGDPPLPATAVKLKRAARKAVRQAVGATTLRASSLLAYSRSLQRSADRAGLLASGKIDAGLEVLLNQRVSLDALRMSPRGLDLVRFWIDADSPLWGRDG
ncbi:MAG: tetratricopeptide repeat protein [Polyangiales bacterium]